MRAQETQFTSEPGVVCATLTSIVHVGSAQPTAGLGVIASLGVEKDMKERGIFRDNFGIGKVMFINLELQSSLYFKNVILHYGFPS